MKHHNRRPMRLQNVTQESDYKETNPVDTVATVGTTEYMAKLEVAILKRKEDEKLAEKDEISIDNVFIEEVHTKIKLRAGVTEPRLAKDLMVTNKVIHNVSNWLIDRDKIKRIKSSRGIWTYYRIT